MQEKHSGSGIYAEENRIERAQERWFLRALVFIVILCLLALLGHLFLPSKAEARYSRTHGCETMAEAEELARYLVENGFAGYMSFAESKDGCQEVSIPLPPQAPPVGVYPADEYIVRIFLVGDEDTGALYALTIAGNLPDAGKQV